MNIITTAFIIAMAVLFIYTCFKEEHIFGRIGLWLKRKLPEGIWKPVFTCPICMTPYYGTLLYVLFFSFIFREWVLVILTACGINVLAVYMSEMAPKK